MSFDVGRWTLNVGCSLSENLWFLVERLADGEGLEDGRREMGDSEHPTLNIEHPILNEELHIR